MSDNLESGIISSLPKKYTEILPETTNLYYIKSIAGDQYALYLNNTKLNIEKLSESLGYITFSINYKDKEIDIQYLQTKLRGVGIAQYLIFILAYIAKTQKIKNILLDDDSDQAHNNSIYQKVGCKYINDYPEPEMKCVPATILSKFNNFIKSAKSKGFFFTKIIST